MGGRVERRMTDVLSSKKESRYNLIWSWGGLWKSCGGMTNEDKQVAHALGWFSLSSPRPQLVRSRTVASSFQCMFCYLPPICLPSPLQSALRLSSVSSICYLSSKTVFSERSWGSKASAAAYHSNECSPYDVLSYHLLPPLISYPFILVSLNLLSPLDQPCTLASFSSSLHPIFLPLASHNSAK